MMAVSPEYRAKAEQLASEVAAATGSRRTWRKVTTLLAHFGVYRLTPAVRVRIGDALREAGIDAAPPLDVVERYGTVRLSMLGKHGDPDVDRDVTASLVHAVSTTWWRPAQAPVAVAAGEMPPPGPGALWLDVDITQASDPKGLHAVLAAICGPTLTVDMVAELLDADQLPGVRELAGGVRNVTAFEVTTAEGQADEKDSAASKAGTLSFQLVEFLQAERWLISCWHKRHPTPDGAREQAEEPPADHRGLVAAVSRWWQANERHTSGELGLAVMAELATSYTRARRTLYVWHETWELDFYERRHDTEITTLRDLRMLSASFRSQLEALNQPGMSRNPQLIWFTGVARSSDAERVDDLIDRALANLRALSDVLRTSTDLVATMSFSEQSRRSERFQELAALVAAVLLVPTLIAGIYGANTRLPGEGHWSGFVSMIITMVLSAAVTLGVIGRWRRKAGPSGAAGRSD